MASRLWDWLLGRLGLKTAPAGTAGASGADGHAFSETTVAAEPTGIDPRTPHDNVFRALDQVLALRRRGASAPEVAAALDSLIAATRICHAAHEKKLGEPTDPDILSHLQEHRLILDTLLALRESFERTDAATVSERLRYLHFLLVSHDLR